MISISILPPIIAVSKAENIVSLEQVFSPRLPKVELGRAEKLPKAPPKGLGSTFDPYQEEDRIVSLDNGKKGKIFSWGVIKFYDSAGHLIGYYGGSLTFFDRAGKPVAKLAWPDQYLKEKDINYIPILDNSSQKTIGYLIIDRRGAATVLRLETRQGKIIAESDKFVSVRLEWVNDFDPSPSNFSGAVVDEKGNLIGVVGGKKGIPPQTDRAK